MSYLKIVVTRDHAIKICRLMHGSRVETLIVLSTDEVLFQLKLEDSIIILLAILIDILLLKVWA